MVITTPAPTPAFKSSECYCPRVTSDLAVQFRDDIEPFRPGDPNGKYEIVFDQCSNPSDCNEVLEQVLFSCVIISGFL